MKKKLLTSIFLLSAFLIFFVRCYDRFNNPIEKGLSDLPLRTHTIKELKAMYDKNGKKPYMIHHGVIIRGVVNTNDTKGNFYRTINIQDDSGGIECKMGMPNMSLIYPRGTEIAINCEGLVLGNYGGQINIGFPSNQEKYETSYIPDALVGKILLKGRFIGIKPIDLSISSLSPKYANMLIRLSKVQFIESELGQTYADPSNKLNTTAVNRTLEDENGNRVIVRTSSYAQFANKKLPEGSGSLIALLSFFSITPQLLIIDDTTDIQLSNPRF